MIECLNYTPCVKGCLQGFASFYVDKWGVEIHGCTLNMKNGSRWVNFPSKEYEKDGQKKYQPLVRFKDKNLQNKFGELAKDAIDRYCMENGVK